MNKQKLGPCCVSCERDQEKKVRTVRILDLYIEVGKVYYVCPECECVFCAERTKRQDGSLCRRLKSPKLVSLFANPAEFLRRWVINYLPKVHQDAALRKLERFSFTT